MIYALYCDDGPVVLLTELVYGNVRRGKCTVSSAGGLRAWTFPLSLEAGPLHGERYGLCEFGRGRRAHGLPGFCCGPGLGGGARIGRMGVLTVRAGGT